MRIKENDLFEKIRMGLCDNKDDAGNNYLIKCNEISCGECLSTLKTISHKIYVLFKEKEEK